MMQDLKTRCYQDYLVDLNKLPNQGILYDLLEHKNSYVLYRLNNNAFMIKENQDDDPFVFIAGNITEDSINLVKKHLRTCKFPMVHVAKKYYPIFAAQGWSFHLRAVYSDYKKQDLTYSSGNKIQKIDSWDILIKCQKFQSILKIYGSGDNFLKHCLGYVLLSEHDILLGEVYVRTSAESKFADIVLIHDIEYLGKGCMFELMSYVLQKLHKTKKCSWAINIDDADAFTLGRRLGFTSFDYHIVLVPHWGNVLCSNIVV